MILREKINCRMDQLQDWMESNHHLTHADEVKELIGSVSFAWNILSEEDRDYIQACQHAVEENMEWKLP